MCQFFSVTSDGKGNIKYFDWELRKKVISGELKDFNPDRHTSINDYSGYKGAAEDIRNKYEYNSLTGKFTVDMINTINDSKEVEAKVKALDFKLIVEPLIIKPIIHPFRDRAYTKNNKVIELLKQWASVASARGSVRASVGGYYSSFFIIEKYKYVTNEPSANPFQSCIDLWEMGVVPSFNGTTWRLHAGVNADVVFEISQKNLQA